MANFKYVTGSKRVVYLESFYSTNMQQHPENWGARLCPILQLLDDR